MRNLKTNEICDIDKDRHRAGVIIKKSLILPEIQETKFYWRLTVCHGSEEFSLITRVVGTGIPTDVPVVG